MVAVSRTFEVRGPMWHRFLEPFTRGAWHEIPSEQCWWGPAGTAKTMSTQIGLDTVLRDDRFHGVRILWIRKTLQSVKQSSLVTFEEQVLHPGDPVLLGPSRPQRESYVYKRPNRMSNELILGGMNNPSRWYGVELDGVVVEEAIEFTEKDIEKIWRAMRPRTRGLGLPFKFLIMLTNPGPKFHWLYRRMQSGRTASFFVGIDCNPSYYDIQTGQLLEAGKKYREDMMAHMTDEVYAHMVEGRWQNAQGMILKSFGPVHLARGRIERRPFEWPELIFEAPHPVFGASLELRWFFAAMDFGDRNPGTIQVFGVTEDSMPVRVAEVYHTDKDIQWWASWCVELYAEFGLRAIVCDNSRPKEIDYINDLIAETFQLTDASIKAEDGSKRASPRIAVPCQKRTQSNNDLTNVALLRYAFGLDNGRPRILLLENAPQIIDPSLVRESKPTGWIEEIPGWDWAEHDDSKYATAPRELPNAARPDHGMDAGAYAYAYLWGRDMSLDPKRLAPKHKPGSYGHMRQFIPWKNKKVAEQVRGTHNA